MDSLYTSELAAVARAVDSRRREFSTARWLARQALQRLGQAPSPIPSGPSREPLWPVGIVGSVTHCSAICAVILGATRDYTGIGLDLEVTDAKLEDLVDIIVSPADSVRERNPHDLRLVFSAKEAVYKCVFPLFHEFLDFQDIAITINHASSSFSAKLKRGATGSHALIHGQGLFEASGNAAATAYLMPAPLAARGRP